MSSLINYYTAAPPRLAIPGYRSTNLFTPLTADFNLDGKQDLLILGLSWPSPNNTQPVAQPGALLFGDGKGGFSPALASVFPTSSLLTVHPRKVVIADFNGDRRPDVFVSSHGWDTAPFPGEQNRLYLSQGSNWVDATNRLPTLSDYSHTSAAGDIDGDGDIDLFVGNGYPGEGRILPYTLMNDGKGQFTLTRANIPVSSGGLLDTNTGHNFPGATLADLDQDGLPELIITADASASYNKLRQTTVLWNSAGTYSESRSTLLPANAFLPNQIVTDAQVLDVNDDGLMDIVQTGTQGQPFYDGWFLQILLNQGNQRFIDATSQLMSAANSGGGIPGRSSSTPWGMWIRPMDFNADGFMDLTLEYNGGGSGLPPTIPLVWLNDGTGHFTTLKAADFASSDRLWQLGDGHLYQTDLGVSVVTPQLYTGSGGLLLTGLLATGTFPDAPDSGLARTGGSGNDRLRGGTGDDLLQGFAGNDSLRGWEGNDTALFQGRAKEYSVTRQADGSIKVTDSTLARDGIDTLQEIEHIRFSDFDINTTTKTIASSVSATSLQRVIELYVAFFNRTPDADGLSYWLTQTKAGMSVTAIANAFYNAGVRYTSITGFSAAMTNADFVNVIYKNVLGRTNGADAGGLAYWTGELASGRATRGSLVSTILDSAHTFKGDATWGWVANLLDNKIAVAKQVAVDWGLNYLTPEALVSNGMAIAKAVTPTDTSAAIALVGIPTGAITLG